MKTKENDWLDDIQSRLEQEYRRLPGSVRNAISELRAFVRKSETENTARFKRAVINDVAQFLERQEIAGGDAAVATAAHLLGETDPLVYAGPVAEAETAAKARDLVAAVRVRIMRSESRKWTYSTEVFRLESGNPVRFASTGALDWDAVPAEIRAEFLSQGTESFSYNLYPISEN